MATLNTNEANAAVKELAVGTLVLYDATQIDDYTYAIPVEVKGELRYAKVTVTAALAKATKTHAAFDLNTAVEAYQLKVAERNAKAEASAKAKAEKEAARAAKAEKEAARAAKAEKKA